MISGPDHATTLTIKITEVNSYIGQEFEYLCLLKRRKRPCPFEIKESSPNHRLRVLLKKHISHHYGKLVDVSNVRHEIHHYQKILSFLDFGDQRAWLSSCQLGN